MQQLPLSFVVELFVLTAFVTLLAIIPFLLILLIIQFLPMPKKDQSAKRVKIAEEFEPQPLEELVANYQKNLKKYAGKNADKPRVDIDFRIKVLTEGLADPKEAHQHENYKAALKLYKAGKSPDTNGWYFVKGKFYSTLPNDSTRRNGEALHIEVWIWDILLLLLLFPSSELQFQLVFTSKYGGSLLMKSLRVSFYIFLTQYIEDLPSASQRGTNQGTVHGFERPIKYIALK